VSTAAICRIVLTRFTDVVGRGGGEGLGAVAALEHEGLTAGDGGHPLAQDVALAGEDERRVAGQGGHGLGECVGVGVGPDRLLGSGGVPAPAASRWRGSGAVVVLTGQG
jgi:hypothetical protein